MFNDSRARIVLNDAREINSGLFFLKVTYQNVVKQSTCNKTKQSIKGDINLWHKRLGHLKKTDVKRTVGCEGDIKDTCETCAMGKQARLPVPKKTKNKAASLSGSKYAVTFIDEYTKYEVVNI